MRPSALGPLDEAGAWRQLHVLVVDDSEALRGVAVALLQQLGVGRLSQAGDGREALAVIEREPVDLVLSDWQMPHMDGLALLQALRRSPATRALPFVMMPADADPNAPRLALEAGAQAVLVKPFHAAALAERLRLALHAGRRRMPTEAAPAAATEPFKPTVLIVDDQPDTLHLMIDLLKGDCRLKLATTGERALALCQLDTPPDLVLLDVVLPTMDGFEVARRLRQHPTSSGIPIVMLSALEEDELQQRALELGAVDFIRKPVDASLLRLRVRNVAQHAAALRQLQGEADQLQRQVAVQDELEQVLSADLRSPLAHALATLEPMLAGEDTGGALSADHRDALQTIEANLLEALDAMHLSSVLLRIEQGQFTLRARAVPLRKVLERAVRLQQEAHAHKNLVWDVQLPGPLRGVGCLAALGDSLLCHSLFQQLLRQACELAPPNSTVKLDLAPRDDGPDGYRVGIEFKALVPRAFRARFFSKFVSLGGDGALHDAAGAVGCYAARRLAQAQRGEVRLQVDDATGCSRLQVLLLRAQALADGA